MWVIITIIVLAILFLVICMYEMTHYSMTHYEINVQKSISALNRKLRIVLITDMHGRSYGNNDKPVKDIINAEPDIILLAGDMIVGRNTSYNDRAADFICRLAEKIPVYYAYGNHESRQEDYYEQIFSDYRQRLIKAGVIFLKNNMTVSEKYDNIVLYGLELPLYSYERKCHFFSTERYLNNKLSEPDMGKLNILMAHDPIFFNDYVKWGADIILSGHVHGGIIRLPFLGGLISPRYELFPKYDQGLYSSKSSYMLVSRGFGNHSLPIRVFNKPEIIIFDINGNMGD